MFLQSQDYKITTYYNKVLELHSLKLHLFFYYWIYTDVNISVSKVPINYSKLLLYLYIHR